MDTRTHTVLLVVFSALFAALLFYGFPDSSAPWFDEGIHLNLARTIAEDNIFSLRTAPGEFVNEKPLLITTNFPLLFPVALSFKLFGIGLWQAKIVMIGFLAVFAYLAYALAKKLYGKESALFAFALLVTFLPLYGNGKSVLGEIPGLVFFLGGLLLVHREKEWPMFFAGILFGLAAATKSSFLIMLGAVAVGELYAMWQRRKFDFDRVLLLSIGMSIPLLIWVGTLIPREITGGFLQNIVELYRNPYAAEGTILPNIKRFFTESTPLHYAFLLLAIFISAFRRGLARLNKEEVMVLVFVAFNFIFYLSTVGWYRYFFPSHLLLLILFPGAVFSFFKSAHIRTALLFALILVQIGVLVVNIRDRLYHNPVPREFGATANERIDNEEVAVIDNPEIAFFVRSENRRLYLRANPRFVFGEEPFANGRMPRFIISGMWQEHPYLNNHLKEAERYGLALSRDRYYLYELSQ